MPGKAPPRIPQITPADAAKIIEEPVNASQAYSIPLIRTHVLSIGGTHGGAPNRNRANLKTCFAARGLPS
jgi:hypothetical protein